MKIKTKRLNIIILALFITANFLLPLNSLAQTTTPRATGSDDTKILEQIDPEIQRLKEEIQKYQDQMSELEKQHRAYENSINIKRQEISNLKNQMELLDSSIKKTGLEAQTLELEVKKTDLEIANLQLEINLKEAEILSQKGNMADIIRAIDNQERKKSYLEILILKGNLGNFFKEVNELQVLEESLNEKLKTLSDFKSQLNEKKDNLSKRREQLDKLHQSLNTKNERLKIDKNVKNQILASTKGQETEFQKLLAEVKAEQAQINADIQNLEIQARKHLKETKGILASDKDFIWPVASRTITAYFHDPDYPYRYIFEHPGVDIGNTSQGTPVRTALSGYVARVKYDGTKQYAYILIIHTNGLSTVYGHISKPYIKEDDFVVQGEVIALSGGMPGTVGSGSLTTGPHLHFEVRLNGIPVDPLAYLP